MTAITHSQTISQITLCKHYLRDLKPKLIQTKLNTNTNFFILVSLNGSIQKEVQVGNWNGKFHMTKRGRKTGEEQGNCGECPLSFLKW